MNHFLQRFLALLVTLWTTGAMLAYDFESGGIYYDLVDGSARVAQSDWDNRYSGVITIPSTVTYDGTEYAVTGIGESAFSATEVTEVNIPESVTFIGSGAFTSCHSLTSLIMPAGLEVLQGNVFDDCVKLEKLVMQGQNPPAECGWQNLDNTVIYVPTGCLSNYINTNPWDNYRINIVEGDGSVDYVFGFQDNDINYRVNPLGSDNVMVARYINEESKYKGEVVIPSDVEYEGKSYKVNAVQSDALSWSQELTKLTLPASIDSIGYNIVGECANFRKLVMLRPTPPITEWQDYLRSNKIVVYVPEGSLAAYSEASPWNEFNLVEGDGSIDYVAGFAVDSINYKVKPLGSDNVSVSRYTNDDSKYKGEIVIPNVVEYEGKTYSVNSIDRGAFDWCEELTKLTLPVTLTTIGEGAFNGCQNLKKLILENPVPAEIRWIGLNQDCIIYVPEGSLEAYKSNEQWRWYNLVEGDGSVDYVAVFAYNGINYKANPLGSDNVMVARYTNDEDKYKGEIVIPATAEYEGKSYIVNAVEGDAFSWCEELTKLTLPASIDSISYNIVGECPNFRKLVMLRPTPPVAEWQDGLRKANVIVYVPDGSLDAYKNAEPWNQFNLIEGDGSIDYVAAFEYDGINYKANPLGSDNVMVARYTNDESKYKGEVIIPDAVEYDGKSYRVNAVQRDAFAWCQELTKLTLPASIDSIAGNIVYDCQNLKKLVMQRPTPPVTEWQNGINANLIVYVPEGSLEAYKSNESWNRLNLIEGDGSVDYVVSFAYDGINYKANPVGSDNVMVARYTDDDNKYKGEIVIPEVAEYDGKSYGVNAIADNAFAWCEELTKLTLPASIDSISYNIVGECPNFRKLVMQRPTPPATEWQDGLRKDNVVVYVPEGSLAAYSEAWPWNQCNLVVGDGTVDYITSFNAGNLYYKVIKVGENRVEVSRAPEGEVYSGDIVIPSVVEYNGTEYSVVRIGESAFANSEITSVVIPETIERINWNAFGNCESLSQVSLPNNTLTTESGIFAGCTALAEIVIPDNMEYVGNYWFEGCSSLSKVTFGRNIRNIYSDAFAGCNSLENIVLTTSTPPYCDSNAFPETVYANCTIQVPGNALDAYKNASTWSNFVNYKEGESLQFYIEKLHYSILEDGTSVELIPIHESMDYPTSVNIPSTVAQNGKEYTVVGIGDYAFNNWRELTSVTIPETVTYIGNNAFSSTAIQSINLPEGLKSIGDYAFAWTPISEVILPEGLEKIGASGFWNCGSLRGISIPASVIEIGRSAFGACWNFATIEVAAENLSYTSAENVLYSKDMTTLMVAGSDKETIEIPSTVTSIAEDALHACGRLQTLNIPASVLYIGDGNITNMGSLQTINVDSENTVYSSVDGVLYNKEQTELIVMPRASEISDFTVPAAVRSIGYEALGNNVISLHLNEGLERIEAGAFRSAWQLNEVTIPSSVTWIGYNFINGNMKKVIVLAQNPPYMSSQNNHNAIVYVPEESLEAYRSAEGWSEFNILPGDGSIEFQDRFAENGIFYHVISINDAEVEVVRPDNWEDRYAGRVVVPATATDSVGNVYRVTKLGNNAFSSCYNLKEVVIDSIEVIGNFAFAWSENLERVIIPDGVEVLNAATQLFENCRSLKEVRLPAEFGWLLGSSAFRNCESLESFEIPKNVSYIRENAFEGCRSLTSITLPEGLGTILESAFQNCESLTSMFIPASVSSIGRFAFRGCKSMKSFKVAEDNQSFMSKDNFLYDHSGELLLAAPAGNTTQIIPDQTTEIPEGAFQGSETTGVDMPESLETIGNSAFADCPNLEVVTVPNQVTAIGNEAFKNCESLTTVTIGEKVETIGNGAFDGCENLTEITMLSEIPPSFGASQIQSKVAQLASASLRIKLPEVKLMPVPAAFATRAEEDEAPVDGAGFSQAVYENCKLYVPEGTIDAYRNAPVWSNFNNIEEVANPVESINMEEAIEMGVCTTQTLTVTFNPEDADNRKVTWMSADTDIVTIENSDDASCTLKAVKPGDVKIIATSSNGKKAYCKVTVTPSEIVSGFSISPESHTGHIGEEFSIDAYTDFFEGKEDSPIVIEWKSDNEEVAKVSGDGHVELLALGKATITAYCEGFFATCNVEVVRKTITSISITPDMVSGQVGDNVQLSVVIDPADYDEDYEVIWSSTNTNVAIVDAYTGMLQIVGIGEADVQAFVEGNIAYCHVIGVEPVVVTGISLDRDEYTGYLDTNFKLTATVEPAGTEAQVEWTTSDASVATVDENGNVALVGVGTATITASCEGFDASCEVTVVRRNPTPIKVISVKLSETEVELELGAEYKLTATVAPSYATNKNLIWSSSDEAVVSVDNGKLTALAAGEAVITVKTTDGSNLEATCRVTVIDPSGVDSAEGESLQVMAANGVIIVKGAKEGSAAEVYSMAGKCVLAKTIESTVEELPVPAPGVYLVRVAGKTFKVAL